MKMDGYLSRNTVLTYHFVQSEFHEDQPCLALSLHSPSSRWNCSDPDDVHRDVLPTLYLNSEKYSNSIQK